jgi:hypothetical protein
MRKARKVGWRTGEGSVRYDPTGVGRKAAGSPRTADLTTVHPGREQGSSSPPHGAEPIHGLFSCRVEGFGGSPVRRAVGVGGESSGAQQQEAPWHALAHLQ